MGHLYICHFDITRKSLTNRIVNVNEVGVSEIHWLHCFGLMHEFVAFLLNRQFLFNKQNT